MNIGILHISLLKFINDHFLESSFLKKNMKIVKDIISDLKSYTRGQYEFVHSAYPIRYGNQINEDTNSIDKMNFFCVYGTDQRKQHSKMQGCFSLLFDGIKKRTNGDENFYYKLYFPLSNDTSQEIFLHVLIDFFISNKNTSDLLKLINSNGFIIFKSIDCKSDYNTKSIDIILKGCKEVSRVE